MKRKFTFFIFLLVFIVVGVSLGFHNNSYNNITTSGMVINKKVNPYRITLRKFAEDINSTEKVEILIQDENTWNLIEKGQYYFVNYHWKNSEKPMLEQIEINDDFGEIYSDKFN